MGRIDVQGIPRCHQGLPAGRSVHRALPTRFFFVGPLAPPAAFDQSLEVSDRNFYLDPAPNRVDAGNVTAPLEWSRLSFKLSAHEDLV